MSERKYELQAIQVDYACDACADGFMRSTGMTLSSAPPKYPHRCDKCDAAQTFLTRYPAIRYERGAEIERAPVDQLSNIG